MGAKWWQWAGGATGLVAAGLLRTGFAVTSGDGKTDRRRTDGPRATDAAASLAPLRAEHRALLPHIEQLRRAADGVGEVPADRMREQVRAAHVFLTEHLIPHAQAEDEVLYPEVDRVLAGVPATATMRRDHAEVARLTSDLAAVETRIRDTVTVADERELRRVLYGAHAVVRLHFAKEEEVYLPLLEQRLTAVEAASLMERLRDAQHGSGAH